MSVRSLRRSSILSLASVGVHVLAGCDSPTVPDVPGPAEAQSSLELPDFAVGSLRVPQSAPAAGTLSLEARIGNTGVADAEATVARFRVFDSATREELASATVPQDRIAAGAESTIAASLPVPAEWAGRTVHVEALADAAESVEEADEANNGSVSPPLPVVALAFMETSGVDLVIRGLVFTPKRPVPACDAVVPLEVTVHNRGDTPSPATSLRLAVEDWIDNTFRTWDVAHGEIPAGESLIVNSSFTFDPDLPALFIVRADADGPNLVTESNETNNWGEAHSEALIAPPAGFDKVWAGCTGTSWDDPDNWIPAGAPANGTEADDQSVYIPSPWTAHSPSLTRDARVRNLGFEDGAELRTAGFRLTASGNVEDAKVLGPGTLYMRHGSDTPSSVRGAVPHLLIGASVVLAGDVGAASVALEFSGRLDLTQYTLAVEGSLTETASTDRLGLFMRSAGARLIVGGTMQPGTGSRNLEAGEIILRGDLRAVAFEPTARLIFDGSVAQKAEGGGTLGDVEVRTPAATGGLEFLDRASIAGRLVVAPDALLKSNGELIYRAHLPQELSPGGYQVPLSVLERPSSEADRRFVMTKDLAFASPTAAFRVASSSRLEVNGFALRVAGNLTVTESSALLMTRPTDRLDVGGNLLMGEQNQWTAGVVLLRGNLTIHRSDRMEPPGTRVIFDGTRRQFVTFDGVFSDFADVGTLGDVEIRTPASAGGVDFKNQTVITGQLQVAEGAKLTQSAGATSYTTRMPLDFGPGGYQISESIVAGPIKLEQDVDLASPTASFETGRNGSIDLNGRTLRIGGDLHVPSIGGPLIMTIASGRLTVDGTLTLFEPRLDAGEVVLRGGFTAGSDVETAFGARFILDATGPQSVWLGSNVSIHAIQIRTRADVGGVTFEAIGGPVTELEVRPGASLTVPRGPRLVINRLFHWSGRLVNEGQVLVDPAHCLRESGSFSGSGNNPCPDLTPPIIADPIVDGQQGNAGWYRSTVTVRWHVTDPESIVLTLCSPASVDEDTAGRDVTCTATSEGGTTSRSVTIRRDTRPPLVNAGTERAPDQNGWYNAPVRIRGFVADDGSGPGPCETITLAADGRDQTGTVSCRDGAGNSASASVSGIDIDRTAPTVIGTPSRAADHGGWYNAPLAVSWEGDDALSGIDACSAAGDYGGPDGAALSRQGSCTDRAGNTGNGRFEFRYDATPPSVNGNPSRDPNHNGWYNHPLNIAWTGTDAVSGVGTCNETTYPGGAGAAVAVGGGVSVTGSCIDRAGNRGSAYVNFRYDATPPTVSGNLSRDPDHNGWYNHPLNIAWTGIDAVSGVDSCDNAIDYAGHTGGALAVGGQVEVTGGCLDLAGNRGTARVTFRYDATPPTIAGVPSPTANLNGWNNEAVTVTFTCTDGPSGVASCTDPTALTGEGAGQSVAGAATDQAGNTAEATVSDISIDLTAPAVTGTASRAPDRNGWYNHAMSVAWSGTDALSGGAGCDGASGYDGPDDGSASVSGSCSDRADNVGVSTFDLRYDAGLPVITFTGNEGTYLVDAFVRIDCDANDVTSGIDAGNTDCPDTDAPAYDFPLGSNTVNASAMDVAGNVRTASTTFTVEVTYRSLGNLVDRSASSAALAASLKEKLTRMEDAQTEGAKTGARRAFINHVEAERGRGLTSAEADVLIRLVQAL